MIEPIYAMALMTGFLGSGHCLGMCGGLISALSLTQARQHHPLLFHLLYHAGRILTYSLIGALAGWLGSVLAYANRFHGVMRLALAGSDLFIIMVGLGTAGLFRRLNFMRLESAGPIQWLSRAAIPLAKPPGSALSALPLGLLMGFLPCGVSFAMAITAAQTSSFAKGGFTMLAFGLGTTPALLLFGTAIDWLSRRPSAQPSEQSRAWMMRGAGLLVAAMGVYHLRQHIALLGWDLSGPLSFFCH